MVYMWGECLGENFEFWFLITCLKKYNKCRGREGGETQTEKAKMSGTKVILGKVESALTFAGLQV